MDQSRFDSAMEVATNISIGYVISLITWQVVAWLYGIPMSLTENVEIMWIFTLVSIARQYVLRRMFNGRSPWRALTTQFRRPDISDIAQSSLKPYCFGTNPSFQEQAENDCESCPYRNGCRQRAMVDRAAGPRTIPGNV